MEAWRVSIGGFLEVLERCEREGDFEGEYEGAYEGAVEVFMRRHGCLKPWPVEEVRSAKGWLREDGTTYRTLYGPSELTTTGSLRDWSCIHKLPHIEAETLLLNGYQDEVQDVCVRPFSQHIKRVKWITLDNSAHFSHVDQRERYMERVGEFLVG
ncbi:hypothetical protein MMC30_003124 [Trapelia coarctata]|nr:hypothetical protein [Trapelia coarctata]